MRSFLVVAAVLSSGCNLVFDISPGGDAAVRDAEDGDHDGAVDTAGDAPQLADPCQGERLQLCLDFDDNAMLGRDRSPFAHHATVTAEFRPRGGGNALLIDGSSLVLVDDTPDHDLPGPLSIDLWLYLERLPEANESFRAVTKEGQYELRVVPLAGVVCTFHRDGRLDAQSSQAITARAWHHVACTYDKGAVASYVDGEPVVLGATPAPVSTAGTGPLWIGRSNTNKVQVPARVDNVRLWQRVLAQSEITETIATTRQAP
ncbi:MAG: LamG domain-containing protein [Kofleriaceae bacterium]